MKKNLSPEKKVDAALSSIDNIEPAVPSPYFYTKVMAKINTTRVAVWEKWTSFFLRPTIAFATICFIIVINAFVLYSKIDDHALPVAQTELASSDEYSETVTALYDLENARP